MASADLSAADADEMRGVGMMCAVAVAAAATVALALAGVATAAGCAAAAPIGLILGARVGPRAWAWIRAAQAARRGVG